MCVCVCIRVHVCTHAGSRKNVLVGSSNVVSRMLLPPFFLPSVHIDLGPTTCQALNQVLGKECGAVLELKAQFRFAWELLLGKFCLQLLLRTSDMWAVDSGRGCSDGERWDSLQMCEDRHLGSQKVSGHGLCFREASQSPARVGNSPPPLSSLGSPSLRDSFPV